MGLKARKEGSNKDNGTKHNARESTKGGSPPQKRHRHQSAESQATEDAIMSSVNHEDPEKFKGLVLNLMRKQIAMEREINQVKAWNVTLKKELEKQATEIQVCKQKTTRAEKKPQNFERELKSAREEIARLSSGAREWARNAKRNQEHERRLLAVEKQLRLWRTSDCLPIITNFYDCRHTGLDW